MNSLTLGFIYVCGFSWILAEACVSASNGNSIPLALVVIGFILMFSILGCLPLSDKAINTAGPIFSILIGLGIIAYAFAAFGDGSTGGGILRIAIGGLMVVLGAMGFVLSSDEEEAH
mgnify:CR=1 FL=1|tara:strand:- start:540 stop:890 length:351 start_codon:yes stop_codon:yes gene_type:complete